MSTSDPQPSAQPAPGGSPSAPADAAATPAAAAVEPCIVIERLTKRYGGPGGNAVTALDEVSLEIRRGEVFALLGPNGAGKTTLMYCLMGLLTPDSGAIRFPGLELGAGDRPAERMNYVSGESRFHWALTVRDALGFYGRIYGLSPAETRARMDELAATFGIASLMDRRFDQLSTGQRMRVVFVKGLLNTPRAVLLDEPTLGLDVDVARKLRDEVRRINRRTGMTVLLTSHYMAEVEALADRVGFIRRGRIADLGTVAEVKARLLRGYELLVTAAEPPSADALSAARAAGWESADGSPGPAGSADVADGRTLRRRISDGEPVGPLLDALSRSGITASRVESRSADLEEYFLKMMREDEGEG
jgi:ABC-2 type transport system ATP-binding protein